MNRRPVFDPGLQPERTELAWRRTLLSLAVGSLVALRLLPPVMGGWSLGLGFAGLAVTAVLWRMAHHRARQTQNALLGSAALLPGGELLVSLAVVAATAAALGLIYVRLSW